MDGRLAKVPLAEALVRTGKDRNSRENGKDAAQGSRTAKYLVTLQGQKVLDAKDELGEHLSRALRIKRREIEVSDPRRHGNVHKSEADRIASAKVSVRQGNLKSDDHHSASKEKNVPAIYVRNIGNAKASHRDAQLPKSNHSHVTPQTSNGTYMKHATGMISSYGTRQAMEEASTSSSAIRGGSLRQVLRRSISVSDLQQEVEESMSSKQKWPADDTKIVVKQEGGTGSRETKRHSQATVKNQGSEVRQLRLWSRLRASPFPSKETTGKRETAHPTKSPMTNTPTPSQGNQRLQSPRHPSMDGPMTRTGLHSASTTTSSKLVQRPLNKLPSSRLKDVKFATGSPDRITPKAPNSSDVVAKTPTRLSGKLEPRKKLTTPFESLRKSQLDEPSLFANGGVNLVSMSSTSSEDYRTILDLPDP